ncbi:MAG: ABC transporter ATP-binding protein [bacterium]|nr:ABC transporter ATP-binding protein [bacterium]
MIEARSLTIRNGGFRLEGASFQVAKGCYSVLMGKTGSGKTTLLEAICGLKPIESGELLLAGQNVTELQPAERGIGYVPQDGALFQSMTVGDHLTFALSIRRWPKADADKRRQELAKLLRIESLLDRYPSQLSGGERQRVALGRALSFHPKILCLDEPLSALDDDTREQMMQLLKQVQRETGVTALHVTHNRAEADELADVRIDIEAGVVKVAKESRVDNQVGQAPA